MRCGVGSLGQVTLRAGVYLYVGSAQRGLAARLRRHARRRKRLRWHVDWLSTRARMLGAIVIDAPRQSECRVAQAIARVLKRAWRGMGSSDCRCGGHLFRFEPAP